MDDYYTEPPPPPDRPLWDGIYEFPWRLIHLRAFLGMATGLLFLDLFAWGYVVLIRDVVFAVPREAELSGAALILYRGSAHIFASLCILSLLASLYPAAYFLRVVEDTAGGADVVDFEDLSWLECAGKLLYLAWTALCSGALGAVLVGVIALGVRLPVAVAAIAILALMFAFFPVCLLSTMMAGVPWVVIHPDFVRRWFARPRIALVVYLNTLFLLLPIGLIAYWSTADGHIWLAPLVGIAFASALMSYGRIVGRAGWVLIQNENRDFKRKWRKPT
jgi:hypothetical protein